MSEFNTGKPPAGESGMCVTEHNGQPFWNYWDGDRYGFAAHCGRSPAIAWSGRAGRDTFQNDPWRWVTLAELTAAGIPESEARGMVHKSMLPEAAADSEWGPWIFCERGSKCPIPHAKAGEYAVRWTEGGRLSSDDLCFGDDWDAEKFWECAAGDFAYRLKRSAAKLEDKPAIAATCAPPDTPPKDELEDEAAMNAAMLDRDLREPAEKPQAAAVAVADPTPWHLRCAPWTNRFGGWGA